MSRFLDQFHNESNDDYQNRFNIAKKQCDEYNSIFEIYYEKRQLEKKLLDLGLTYDDLSNAAVSNVGKVSYDFLVEIQNYNIDEINKSVWQYSLSAQKWLNSLLGKIDEWENDNLDLVNCPRIKAGARQKVTCKYQCHYGRKAVT